MVDPEVTVLMPTYRRPALLRRAMRSALDQTYGPLRVHVFDNASGDETPDVVAELAERDPRVRYDCQPENIGATANFQHALDSVETPYFAFLSDDDLLFPGFCTHAVRELARHEEARFFCGQTVIFNPGKGKVKVRPDQEWQDGAYEAGRHVLRMSSAFFTWTACLFSSEIRERIGPLDATFADAYFVLQATALFPFVVSLVPCALYTVHGGSVSKGLPLRKRAEGFRIVVDRLAEGGGVPAADLAALRDHVDDGMRRAEQKRLKTAFYEEDWATFDDALHVMRGYGGLHGWPRFFQLLAHRDRRASWLLRAARGILRAHRRWSRGVRERTRPSPVKLAELVERYGRMAIEKEEGAAPP